MAAIPLISRVRSLFKYDSQLARLQRDCTDGESSACNALDGELLLLAQKGNRYAMDELLNRHYVPLYRFTRRLTRNDHDAEDMVHTAFMTTTLEKLDQLAERVRKDRNGEQPFQYRAYLTRSARNRFLDEQKLAWRAWRHIVEDDSALQRLCDAKHASSGGSAEPQDHLATQRLLKALFRLPPEQEEALTLKVSGYSMEEIADIQNVPVETARDRRKTAARKLKSWLADMER